jgi:DNA-binding CsgD family transcriptional regulator
MGKRVQHTLPIWRIPNTWAFLKERVSYDPVACPRPEGSIGEEGPLQAFPKLLAEFARIGSPKEPAPSQHSSENAEEVSWGILKPRQIEVLKLLAEGLSYKEVGARLFLSPRTIKYHTAEIMNRLHLENRAQVLAFAGRMGLVGTKPVE